MDTCMYIGVRHVCKWVCDSPLPQDQFTLFYGLVLKILFFRATWLSKQELNKDDANRHTKMDRENL